MLVFTFGLVDSTAHAYGDPGQIIAKVGKRLITVNDFKDALLRKFQSPVGVDNLSLQEREACLDGLIENILILNEAYRRQLDSDGSVVAKMQRFRSEALTNRLVEYAVVDSVLTDERLRRFYEKYGGELRLRQILIPAPGGIWSQTQDSLADKQATELAEKLYNDILPGKDFAAVARDHSQDMSTAAKGGDLGYIRWGQLTKEVQDVAFALPVGTVSTPIRSGLGYHIIRVIDKKKRSFDEEKSTIKYQLAATYGRTIQSRQDDFINTLAKQYRATFHYSNFERLAKLIGPHFAPFSNLKEQQNNMQLASFVGGSITVADLVKRVGDAAVNYRWDEQNIESWTRRLTLNAIMVKEATSRRIDVSGDVLRFKEEQMVELLRERELERRITASETALREYFDQHRERFQSPATVRVQEILLNEQYLAAHVTERAKQGENFEKLVVENSLRPESRANGGDLGYIDREQHPEIFDAAINRRSGEIYGPFQILEGLCIIKILDHRAPHIQTFEEARTKVNYLFGEEKRQKRYARWIGELKRKYKIEVRREVLESTTLSND